MRTDNSKLIERTKQLYLDGKTADEISEIINISGRSIRKWLTSVGVFVPNRTRYNNINFFSNIDTEEKAYWLGFIYADGSLSLSQYSLIIRLNKNDDKHLLKLVNIFGGSLKYYETNHSVSFVITSSTLYQDLINDGIEPQKTYSENTWVFSSVPDNLIHHFVRGFFDGDGTITYSNNDLRKCRFGLCGTETFLLKIQDIMHKNIFELDIKPRLSFNTIYYLTYGSHKDIKAIYNWLYNGATVYLDRKKYKYDQIIDVLLLKTGLEDRENSPYKGSRKKKNTSKWISQLNIDYKNKFIKLCNSELEAAYYHDLEQVRQRGEEAKRFMNFPSKYNDFVEWIKEGY